MDEPMTLLGVCTNLLHLKKMLCNNPLVHYKDLTLKLV